MPTNLHGTPAKTDHVQRVICAKKYAYQKPKAKSPKWFDDLIQVVALLSTDKIKRIAYTCRGVFFLDLGINCT
jgi:hypothetical protein